MSPRAWRILCQTSFGVLLVITAVGGLLEQRLHDPSRSPLAWFVLGLAGTSLLAFVLSVPPVALRWFIVREQRLGRASSPVVVFLVENERTIVYVVWLAWGAAALIVVPAALQVLARGQ